MNAIAIAFLIINAGMLFILPKRWAPLPLIAGACYMTLGQGIELGSFTFTVIRFLLAVGVVRVIIKKESLSGGMNSLDWLMVIWAGWAVFSSVFHNPPKSALIFRLGLIYNTCGIYFLIRIFCVTFHDVILCFFIIAILLIPVAAEMIYEKIAVYNLFSILGGISESPTIREGNVRAQGPFAHSILAGTVGAVCLPLMVGLWRFQIKMALFGMLGCLAMVFSSRSSGPILSALVAIGALFMWKLRNHIRLVRWLSVIGYLCLDLVMKAPPYYLMARIDLSGGSTGWHRAQLINSAIKHLDEWWFAGTDYTRHWMPTGVSWSPNHTDITNHYLQLGVIGGLPLMILFISILWKAFYFIGKALQKSKFENLANQFFIWAIGASLFAHVVTFISVSYFDQSIVFLYITLGAIGSCYTNRESILIYNNIFITSSGSA